MPGPSTLCLNDGRFEVRVAWRGFQGETGFGRAVASQAEDSGMFWFFDDENWEMLVKVLDGCGVNGHFWVFAAATTNVEYTLAVRDTASGEERSYVNPLRRRADAITDTGAFATCAAAAGGTAGGPPAVGASGHAAPAPDRAPTRTTAGAAAPCTPGPDRLCLQEGRFRVEVEWSEFGGDIGEGHTALPGTGDSGLFWFFARDNWEMLVKVLDGCGVNGHFWVFAAATTNVGYELRVTDTFTGMVRTFSNPLGRASPALTETRAFATCDAPPPDSELRFVWDRSVVLTPERREALLEVEVVGGGASPDGVTWSSSDPDLVSVTAGPGGTATVRAAGEAPAHAEVFARLDGAEAIATVMLAEPAPATVVIASRRVRAKAAGEVELERTPVTGALRPGDVLVSGDAAGVLGRVTSVAAVGSDRLRVGLADASLTDAFDELRVVARGQALERRAVLSWPGPAVTLYDGRGRVLARQLVDEAGCDAGAQAAGLDLQGAEVSVIPRLRGLAELDLSGGRIRRFALAVTGRVTLEGTTGRLTFDSSTSGSVECSVTLEDLELVSVPLSALTVSPTLAPVVGIEAAAQFDGPRLSLVGPHGSASGTVTVGTEYVPGGWRSLGQRDFNGDFQPVEIEADQEVEFTATLGPFVGLEAGLEVELGRTIEIFGTELDLGVDLAEFSFLDLRAVGEAEVALGSPFRPRRRAYGGPAWELYLAARGNLRGELDDGVLFDVLDWLGVPTGFDGELELFELRNPLAASPHPTFLRVLAEESCTGLPRVEPGERVEFVVQGDPADGEAEVWGELRGREPIARRAAGDYGELADTGRAEAVWIPGQGDGGVYRFHPRLRVDVLSRELPYAHGEDPFADVLVARGDGVPVIEEITPNPVRLTGAGTAELTVRFSDGDAGVERAVFEVVEQECGAVTCGGEGGVVEPDVGTLTEGSFTTTARCDTAGTSFLTVVFSVVLEDCQGHRSEPATVVVECLPQGELRTPAAPPRLVITGR